MASKVKVEPPDEGDAAFGMNGYESEGIITLELEMGLTVSSFRALFRISGRLESA